MIMWENIIEYLKDPLLVVKVQNFFGVIYKNVGTNVDNAQVVHADRLDRETEGEVRHHKRIPSDISGSSQTSCDTDVSADSSSTAKGELECHINNKFWYYLFVVGTALGDEIFYATFIPFWFWNIDGAVGRRVVLVWTIVMYIGQGFKDIIRWPRPGYPVRRLQSKWAVEYGMPSTHAMVAVCMPFSVLVYTADRYVYPVHWGAAVAVAWCALICVSRLYLGMHSVLDVAAGLALAAALLAALLPLVDRLDGALLTAPLAPAAVLAAAALALLYYPQPDRWTPTRGDTAMIVSVCAGILCGSWVNYQLGRLRAPAAPPPHPVLWPSAALLGLALLRTALGLCGVLATRALAASASYALVCALLGKDKNELRNSADSLDNRHKIAVELCYKCFTYGLVGLNTTCLFPHAFRLLRIDRPSYYTEM